MFAESFVSLQPQGCENGRRLSGQRNQEMAAIDPKAMQPEPEPEPEPTPVTPE